MSNDTKLKTFSVSRTDLLYDYAKDFREIFKFTAFKDESPILGSGIRFTESLGYDFQNECTPIVEIIPIGEEEFKATNIHGEISDFEATIYIEDIGLSIRKIVCSIPLSDIQEKIQKTIDLNEYADLSFYRGFEIKCFVNRQNDIEGDANSHIIWSKSQIIHQENFIVKASNEEALFQITWSELNDNELYFVNWSSSNVSSEVDVDCFQVVANANLKDQFKRLENNKHFGGFCIRMVASQILQELLIQCLRFADLNEEPQPDSLHEKFESLLSKNDFDFVEIAKDFQSDEPLDQMSASSDVTKFMQRMNQVGSVLDTVKFGGYR